MKLIACFAALAIAWLLWSHGSVTLAASSYDISSVNSSVQAEGGQAYGKLSTVNGQMRVGRGATADEARTVNGSIVLEDDVRVGTVSTVNGSVTLSEGVQVAKEASTVNGRVQLRKGARVGGDVATVSGGIELTGAEVAGELRTHNGDIELDEGARVLGGIHVKDSKSWSWNRRDPVRVRICSTCVVEGELRFDRPVELRVEDGGRIGKVTGDDVRRL